MDTLRLAMASSVLFECMHVEQLCAGLGATFHFRTERFLCSPYFVVF